MLRAAAIGLSVGVAGCAAYHARPLPSGPDLAAEPTRLNVDIARLDLAPLKAHRFDPADGLDPTEAAVLAVLNSPDLNARRAAAGVAEAQAFAAGLLPDPQIAVTFDLPVQRAGYVNAYNVNPSLDIAGLITHSSALKAARATARQADLDLLWSEWNTAQQARQLAVTILADEAKAQILSVLAADLAERYSLTSGALRTGDVTIQTNAADLAAKLDAEALLAAATRDAAKARGDLNALLGLEPAAHLDLVAGEPPPDLAPGDLDRALTALQHRRPDLLALRAGYEAQDANVRKAILAQFPIMNLGFSHASDTSHVITNGLTATLTVPIFRHARGDIAVQSASREQLRAEYQARLDQTVADVATARRVREEARTTLAGLERDVPRLTAMAQASHAAYRRGDIDGGAWLALQQAALTRRVALMDQRLTVTLADIGLESVLFLPSDQGAAP